MIHPESARPNGLARVLDPPRAGARFPGARRLEEMKIEIAPTWEGRAYAAEKALEHLRIARDYARRAGSKRTLARIRLALTSAGGALRHAQLGEWRRRG